MRRKMRKSSLLFVFLWLTYVCVAQTNNTVSGLLKGSDCFPELRKTVYPFLYTYTAQDVSAGHYFYFIVNKLECVDPQLTHAEDIYIKEWQSCALEKLSSDFDIYVYYIERKCDTIKVKENRIASICKLSFHPDRMQVMKRFTIRNSKDSIDSFQAIVSMINRMGESIENKIERATRSWPLIESTDKHMSLNSLHHDTLLRNVEWFDVYPILNKKPPINRNVKCYFYICDQL